jgi:hypothetical protein
MSRLRVEIREDGSAVIHGGFVWFGSERVHLRDLVVTKSQIERELSRIGAALSATTKEPA